MGGTAAPALRCLLHHSLRVKSITVQPHCPSGYLDRNGCYCAHFINAPNDTRPGIAKMMIDALTKGLNQKPAMIKGAPPVTPSRAFALWLALLFLYVLLLPSAAETPEQGPAVSLLAEQSVSAAPLYRDDAATRERPQIGHKRP
jgi:hypothetical protein